MTIVTPIQDESVAARHARLFELIRQNNLAEVHSEKMADQHPTACEAPQHTVREFANAARRSLLPQEQQALGITSSFGR